MASRLALFCLVVGWSFGCGTSSKEQAASSGGGSAGSGAGGSAGSMSSTGGSAAAPVGGGSGEGGTSGGGSSSGGTSSGTGGSGGTNVPDGKTLLEPGDVDIYGVTTDDYVIYALPEGEDYVGEVRAVPMRGGTPVTIVPDQPLNLAIRGRTVFTHDTTTGLFTVWTPEQGPRSMPMEASAVHFHVAANAEGTRIAFRYLIDGVAYYRMANADLTGIIELGTGFNAGICTSSLAYVGNRFITHSCDDHAVNSWDEEGNKTTLFPSDIVKVVAHPADGGRVFAYDNSPNAYRTSWVPASGGEPTLLGDFSGNFMVSDDGSAALLYGAPGSMGALSITDPTSPNLVQLTPMANVTNADAVNFVQLSPDDLYISHSGGIYSVADRTDGELVEGLNDQIPIRVAFTPDSQFILFGLGGGASGSWNARHVAGGERIRLGDHGPSSGYNFAPIFGIEGSKIAYVRRPEYELVVHDLASGTVTPLASYVLETFALSTAKTAVAYRVVTLEEEDIPDAGAGPTDPIGLYAAPIP